MSQRKNTTIINEVGFFFKNSGDEAMNRIIMLLKAVKMTDNRLGLKSKCNVRRKASEKLQLLTLLMIQYNLLATVKRFDGYETFGELFRAAGKEALELTLTQRIYSEFKIPTNAG